MPNVGPMELIVVLVIALVILGPKKLPEMGRSVGKGMREFKDSLSGGSPEKEQAQISEQAVRPAATVED